MMTGHQEIILQAAIQACDEVDAWLRSRHRAGTLEDDIYRLAAGRVVQHRVCFGSVMSHPEVFSDMTGQRILLDAQLILDLLEEIRNEKD